MSHHERVRLTFSFDDLMIVLAGLEEGTRTSRAVLSQLLREKRLQQCHGEDSTSGRIWPLGREVGEKSQVPERSALLATCLCVVTRGTKTPGSYIVPASGIPVYVPSMWPIRCWISDGTGYITKH